MLWKKTCQVLSISIFRSIIFLLWFSYSFKAAPNLNPEGTAWRMPWDVVGLSEAAPSEPALGWVTLRGESRGTSGKDKLISSNF